MSGSFLRNLNSQYSPESQSSFASKEDIDSKNLSNEIEECKNYILNQKELLKKIHHQQKKLKSYRRNNSLSSLQIKQTSLSFSPENHTSLKRSQFELQKARLKKESLENEIDLLENQLKMKRPTDLHSPTMDTNLNISFESNRKVGYDDLMKLTNERDFYKQKFSFEATQRDVENKELRNQLCKIREELALEQKSSRDKMTRLEEDLKQANNRFETTLMEKEEFSSKVKHLENKIASLQYEVSRREKESYGKEFLENTEKHLTNLCQTLTVQLEDVKFQLRVAEEKIKRSEAELNSKEEKINCYSYASMNQIENLKKEMEQSSDSYQKMKRAYEEQLSVYLIKEKEFCEIKDQMIKEKDDEILDLRAQLTDAKNFKMNSQQIQDALIEDYKRTISVYFV
ncbi:hypothetical protein BpHYR1_053577 [Brachionus plicatilis]|uniref:Uncharacterized protein n=1 Tax=Brachionus plicatilis TaxID=10195 RepID=A0A3M7QYA9_BRAPC|nr:hypothetical protein BpHYR1_053577 [Brachionus plicatilis]